MVIPYPRIPPTIVSIGPIALRWYSLMYVVGYVLGYRLVLRRVASGRATITRAQLDTLLWYLVVGILIAAPPVYVPAYARAQDAAHPLHAFAPCRAARASPPRAPRLR